MTPALPDDRIRHSESDHNHFADELRARLSPGARREYSGNRRLVPVEVPDVVE
jgi:hypothetical protein